MLSLVAGSAIAAPPVEGEGGQGDHPPRFPVDLKDLEARSAERFARADTNRDGGVSLDEFAAALPPDRHRDGANESDPPSEPGHGRPWGKLKPEEIAEQETAVFAALDRNGDGQIERDEFSLGKVHEELRKERQRAMFSRLDKNVDGALTRDEMAAPAERLRTLDTDQDGTVTRAEARAYRRACGRD
jgi:Ca2+-binding EF-hand superfamily protein